METVRESWTDERLDDLNHRADDLSRRMDAGFRELREEMRVLRTETNSRLDRLDVRLDAMQRTMMQFGGAIFAAMAGMVVTQLALILTQV